MHTFLYSCNLKILLIIALLILDYEWKKANEAFRPCLSFPDSSEYRLLMAEVNISGTRIWMRNRKEIGRFYSEWLGASVLYLEKEFTDKLCHIYVVFT